MGKNGVGLWHHTQVLLLMPSSVPCSSSRAGRTAIMPTSLLVPGERCSCDCQLQPQLCGKPVGRASNLIFGASHIWVDQSRIQQGLQDVRQPSEFAKHCCISRGLEAVGRHSRDVSGRTSLKMEAEPSCRGGGRASHWRSC